MALISAFTPVFVAVLCGIIAFFFFRTSWRSESSSGQNPPRTSGESSRPWVDEDLQDDTEISGKDNEDDDWTVSETENLPHVPYSPPRYSEEEMMERSQQFFTLLNQRRSVRFISPEPVPRDIIHNVIRAAGTQLNTQLTTYSPLHNIRDTHDAHTSLITSLYQFLRPYSKILDIKPSPTGDTLENNCTICDLILNVGLVTVTTTPLNCGPQLRLLLRRPANEKLLMLLPVGYPSPDATVPDLTRKQLDDLMVFV
uniref:Uncharacterized protein n=1 Tax=Astyanax mexicanus TaxID=7994 RepID=A0A8B9HZ20_ASTMX